MPLDARMRSSIYQSLVPILGDEGANALMSEFPSVEADELVTRDHLRAELELTRSVLRGEMAVLRDELRDGLADLRAEMADLRGETRAAGASLENRLTLRIGAALAAQTTLVLAAIGLLG